MTGQYFGFPQRFRLKKATEFNSVFSNPVKSTDRYFTILAIPTSFGHPRVGLAITKKIIRTAVRRNVIKRTVRESFRLQRQVMGSMDLVVLVRKDALDASVGALRVSLTKHWFRLVSRCA